MAASDILGIIIVFGLCCLVGCLLDPRTKREKNETKAKTSKEKYFSENGHCLIKRDPNVDVRLEVYWQKNYVYNNETPYYRTIALKNVATTELVDNRGWKKLPDTKTNKYMFGVNNLWYMRPLYLDDSLIESAQKANLPRLKFDENNRAFLDFSDQTGLYDKMSWAKFDADVGFKYSEFIMAQEKFINSDTNALISKEEGEKIVRWMKGYDN